jgi:hypothetical protein
VSREKSFSQWAQGPGQDIVQAVAAEVPFSVLGRARRARQLLWRELQAAATSDTLAAALDAEAGRYARLPGELANTMEPDKFVADWRPFVVPRFLVNAVALHSLQAQLAQSHVLGPLRGGPSLRSCFLGEFVRQMDAVFTKMPFNLKSPLPTANEWAVIGFDAHFDWGAPPWPGHYYLVQTKAVEISRSRAETVAAALAALKARLGRMPAAEVGHIAQAWQAWGEGRAERLLALAAALA